MIKHMRYVPGMGGGGSSSGKLKLNELGSNPSKFQTYEEFMKGRKEYRGSSANIGKATRYKLTGREKQKLIESGKLKTFEKEEYRYPTKKEISAAKRAGKAINENKPISTGKIKPVLLYSGTKEFRPSRLEAAIKDHKEAQKLKSKR